MARRRRIDLHCDLSQAPRARRGCSTACRALKVPDGVRVEVIVVDNDPASDPATPERRRRRAVRAALAARAAPQRRLRAQPRGRERARRWLAFVDDDEVVDESWLAAYWERAAEGECDGYFGPVLPRLEAWCTPWLDVVVLRARALRHRHADHQPSARAPAMRSCAARCCATRLRPRVRAQRRRGHRAVPPARRARRALRVVRRGGRPRVRARAAPPARLAGAARVPRRVRARADRARARRAFRRAPLRSPRRSAAAGCCSWRRRRC